MKEPTTEELAKQYFSEYAGKVLPLDLLLAYISQEHEHHCEEYECVCADKDAPYVNSLELEKFAIVTAVETGHDRQGE